MTVLVIFFFAVVATAAAVANYWDAIASLPESAGAFLGALAGVGGGLLAILAGALLNANENRKRDNRLRNVEIVAVTNALAVELMKLYSFSHDHAALLRQPPPASFRALVMGRPPSTPVFEKVTGQQLGLLNSEALKNLVEAHYTHEILTRMIEETVTTATDLDELANDEILETLARRHDNLAQAAKKAGHTLYSSVPKL